MVGTTRPPSSQHTADRLPLRAGVFTGLATLLLAMTLAVALPQRPAGWDEAAAPELRVDINTADVGTLQLLPRIGPALSSRIIEQREQTPFEDAPDLERVHGIGPFTVDRLAEHVVFSADPPRD